MRLCALIAFVFVLGVGACSTGASPRATRSSAPEASTTVLAQNLALFEGEVQAVRLGFQPAENATDIIIDFTPDSAQIAICPLADPADTLPPVATCKSVGSGVRETISSPGLGAIGIVLTGTKSVRANVRLEFDDRGRKVTVIIPFIGGPPSAAECADNGCNPFFEIRPVKNGLFTASAHWTGATATLVMLQGSVVGRSQTATGVPYRKAALQNGKTSASVRTQLTAPGEYALALVQAGTLRNVRIDASWP
jgi:hypothetical protein